MAQINDTLTFPVTTPAKGDMIIGTDVSDTGNSPNGETVNFTLQGIHDVTDTSSSWHWYNSENYGDSGDGALFDFDVDGSGISSVDTPNFEDGYEYAIILDEIGTPGSTIFRFIVDYETANSATVSLNPISSVNQSGRYEFISPRFPRKDHSFRTLYGLEANNITPLANKDRIVKVTITTSSGSFDTGRILLARRRDFLT